VGQSVALGASAAVLAIVMAISFYVPDYTLYLMFLGPVKLKYIALVTILIDILSIKSGNAGGHLAHLGGAFLGFIYAAQLRKGAVFGMGFRRFADKVAGMMRPKPRMKVHRNDRPPGRPETDMEYNARRAAEQRTIDQILDKIARSGYEGLSKEEKEILFRSSKK
jgi:hypothetical protein